MDVLKIWIKSFIINKCFLLSVYVWFFIILENIYEIMKIFFVFVLFLLFLKYNYGIMVKVLFNIVVDVIKFLL